MSGKEPVDFFRLLFDDPLLQLIVTETNCYAEQHLESHQEYLQQHPQARAHDWRRTPLSQKELEAFLSLLLVMGVCGLPSLRFVNDRHKYTCKNIEYYMNAYSKCVYMKVSMYIYYNIV